MKEREQSVAKALEILSKKSSVILTEDFAYRVCDLVREIPDNTLLATLFGPWNSSIHYRGGKVYPTPSEEWRDFMEGLDRMERTHLCCLINRTMWRERVVTLGELREFANLDGSFYGVGIRGHAFERVAFGKNQ